MLQLLGLATERPDALQNQKWIECSFIAEAIMRMCKEHGVLTVIHDVSADAIDFLAIVDDLFSVGASVIFFIQPYNDVF